MIIKNGGREMGVIEIGVIVYIGVLAAIALKSRRRVDEQMNKLKL
jgi:hypothetical protein